MTTLEAQIKIINDKLQQLLKRNSYLQKENERLTKELNDLKDKEKEFNTAVFSLNQKVNILQAATGNMTETEQKEFEKRIDKYIREIDKCIGMLSE